MGNAHAWNVDLKIIYGNLWKDKKKFYLREDWYESPDKNLAGLLYGIMEIGVSKEIGRLAVFRGKQEPELVANLSRLECWHLYDSSVQFGKGSLFFIHRFVSRFNRLSIQICALDMERRELASVDRLDENFYHVRHESATRYAFKKMNPDSTAGETLIDMKELKWEPLSRWTGRPYDGLLTKLIRLIIK